MSNISTDNSNSPALPSEGGSPSDRQPAELAVLQKFREIFKAAQEQFSLIEDQAGISGAQLWALAEVIQTPGMKVSELSRALAIHPATASNMLDKLESRGLIRRERNKSDQRVVRLYPTEFGQQVAARAPSPAKGLLPDALSRLSAKDLATLGSALDGLLGTMTTRRSRAAFTPLAELAKRCVEDGDRKDRVDKA